MKKVELKEFFEYVFGDLEGYLALAQIDRRTGDKRFKNKFFRYPDDLNAAIVYVEKNKHLVDIYFAPFLTTKERRRKEDIAETPVVWADGDECPIEALIMSPSVIIRTSNNRHSYLWKFREVQIPEVGEEISKRIAKKHEPDGMDQGGWDLTQLLRVPGTYNHKYDPPQVIGHALILEDVEYDPEDFTEEDYPKVEPDKKLIEFKKLELPDKSPEEIFNDYAKTINPKAMELYREAPTVDWSKALWELELTLAEAGMTPEEIFVIAEQSECNKYKRDGRPAAFLWKEVQRAYDYVERRQTEPPPLNEKAAEDELVPVELLTEEEKQQVRADTTFIEEYTEWAKTLGDAAPAYHPAGAFVILSTLLASHVKLPTSFGTVLPNLWFMILADTTLTRKSTAMDNATDLLLEVDYDALLATDGSVEGLLTALGTRPGRSSLFLRDEVTGLIESLKKEYMSGMMETLTKLYDGKPLKRILRKETIDVRDPVLIFFSGGILNKMMDLLNHKHIASGFLPRFIFITAESDITRLKPIGPPTEDNKKDRLRIIKWCKKMHETYVVPKPSSDGQSVTLPKKWKAELDPEAWDLYNHYEVKLVDYAINTYDPSIVTPMMDRLSKSGLKAAVLIAASRLGHERAVRVTKLDVLHAFYYIEQWMKHSLYIINNIGTTEDEKKIKRVLYYVDKNPGISRSNIMQRYYLTAREADSIFATLEQRNNIRRDKRGGKGERIYPVAN